jgi:hypothetical protein
VLRVRSCDFVDRSSFLSLGHDPRNYTKPRETEPTNAK